MRRARCELIDSAAGEGSTIAGCADDGDRVTLFNIDIKVAQATPSIELELKFGVGRVSHLKSNISSSDPALRDVHGRSGSGSDSEQFGSFASSAVPIDMNGMAQLVDDVNLVATSVRRRTNIGDLGSDGRRSWSSAG